jgi:hypothetical protein
MKRVTKFRILLFAVAIAAAAIAMGCASTPLHTEGSTSGISSAEVAGAAKVPQASLHVQLAKEEVDAAKALDLKGDKAQAASMLSRAEADAELAVALAKGDTEKKDAEDAMARVRQLHHDNP